jgi:hypothetical protein
MDPYLEGDLWGDCIRTLASKIRQMLMPKLRPHYTARLDIHLIEEHRIPTIEIRDAANNSLITGSIPGWTYAEIRRQGLLSR